MILLMHFNNTNITKYDSTLDNLNLPLQIKQYSQAVVLDLVNEFNKQTSSVTIPWKSIIIASSIIISVLIGATIVNALLTDWAPTIKGTIEVVQDMTKCVPNIMDGSKVVQESLIAVKSNVVSLAIQLMTMNQHLNRLTQSNTMLFGIIKAIIPDNKVHLLQEAEEIIKEADTIL